MRNIWAKEKKDAIRRGAIHRAPESRSTNESRMRAEKRGSVGTGLPAILFEDEAILAFDKPSGLLVAPDRWNKDLANLMQMVQQQVGPEIHNVHRLDRETSGVLLCTKGKESLNHLSGQFQAGTVKKCYIAIVLGRPPEDEMMVARPLQEDPSAPGRMRIVRRGGKACETRLNLTRRWRGYSLVEAFPVTGRTHQVRVHLACLGCPIVADSFYGDGRGLLLSSIKPGYKHKQDEERPLLGRLGLHARSLTIRHPRTGQIITIESPLPREFEVAIKYLDRFVR